MRTRLNLLRGLPIFIVAVITMASAHAYTFRHESSETKSPSLKSDCSAGAITGEARAWSAWTVQPGGTPATEIDNLGSYGARWSWVTPESQYSLTQITQVNNVNDEVINAYKAISGSKNNNEIVVSWSTTGNSSGSAQLMNTNDPSWWWHPTVNITDDRPLVEKKVGSGNWADVGITASPDPDGSTPHNENDVRTAQLTTWENPTPTTASPLADPNNANGRFVGTTTISGPQVGMLVRARVVLHISVSGSVDNATVTDWRVWVDGRLFTSMR